MALLKRSHLALRFHVSLMKKDMLTLKKVFSNQGRGMEKMRLEGMGFFKQLGKGRSYWRPISMQFLLRKMLFVKK